LLDFLEVVLSSIVSSGFPSELGEERKVSSQGRLLLKSLRVFTR